MNRRELNSMADQTQKPTTGAKRSASDDLGETSSSRPAKNDKTPRDEDREITHRLDAGTHDLILESNSGSNTKCRARSCIIVEKHDWRSYTDAKIRGPYRVNLQQSKRDKPDRRFFHVDCLEAIGFDLAKYLSAQ